MSHTITPTLWNAEICADCGFRIDQHRVLYGTTDDMAETLAGLEAPTEGDASRQGAVRAISEVRNQFVADRDRIMRVVNAGGSLPEMRAAVDAAWLYKEIIAGLDLAIERALGTSVEEER